MDSGPNPVEPCLRVDLGGEEAVDVDLYDKANQKVRKPMCRFGGKIWLEYFIPGEVSFFTGRGAPENWRGSGTFS